MKRQKPLIYLFIALAIAFTGRWISLSANPLTYPLIYQSDLVYQGAFRAPDYGGAYDVNTLNYGGQSITFNPANNSIFVANLAQSSTEIGIPQIVNSTNISSLNRATIVQALRDATNGTLGQINPSDVNKKIVGGHLVYNGKLYVSAYSYYDGGGTQDKSHWVRPINLTTTGQTLGPLRVGNQYPGFVSGYMTWIPSDWQALFGGPALTGNCCLAIVGQQSNGPAASVFDPEDVGSATPVPAIPVVGYPVDHPLGPGWGTTNGLFNGTTWMRGIVFPEGSRSVLFVGRHGIGTWCYGTGAECGDQADDAKGTHAYPYVYQIWAYDALDLLAVKNGTKQQWEPQPYAVWQFTLPFSSTGGMHELGGAAYDPQTGRIIISQMCAEGNCAPVFHVFSLNLPTAVSQGNVPDLQVNGIAASPNPFNPEVTISFSGLVAFDPSLKVGIYSVSGKFVADLSSRVKNGRVAWNASGMQSGIYIVKAQTEKNIFTKAITLVK